MDVIKVCTSLALCLLLVACKNENYEVPLGDFLFSQCHVDEVEAYDLPWNKRANITQNAGFDNKRWLITKKDLANGVTGEWSSLSGFTLRNDRNIKEIDGVSNFTMFKESDYESYEVQLGLTGLGRIESHSTVELYNKKDTLTVMLTNEYIHLKIDGMFDKYYFLTSSHTNNEIYHDITIRKIKNRKLIFYGKNHIATIKSKDLDLTHFGILIKPYPYIVFRNLTISKLYI